MKTKEFETKDGNKGYSYHLEVGDEVIAKFSAVGSKDRPVIKDGKPIIIKNNFLGVEHDGKEITLSITSGQKKILDKTADLTDKTITAYEYENEFGKQIGVRVK